MNKSEIKDAILAYYHDDSKHSVYQSMPEFVKEGIGVQVQIDQQWRGDMQRYLFILEYANLEGKSKMDIGANTGFFALKFANEFKGAVTAYEVNTNHAKIMNLIGDYFDMENFNALGQGVGLDDVATLEKKDMVLLFNVLHHAGDDYDKHHVSSVDQIKAYYIKYLSVLRTRCKELIFQVGYNWQGNKQKPIIETAQGEEMIAWMNDIFQEAGWKIDHLGLAKEEEGTIVYKNVPLQGEETSELIKGHQAMKGEFYKRPLFICSHSK